MSDLQTLSHRLCDLWRIAIAAADPAAAVHRALDAEPVEGPAQLLAVGKAACAMMTAALERVTAQGALVVTSYQNVTEVPGAEVLGTGHPQPDGAGLAAAMRVQALAEALGPNDQLLLLLSGGGSALLPCPIAGVTLADKQATSDLLLASGLPIQQVNLVRQHLSRLKGGGLAACAHPAAVRTLILSDVIGGDLRAVSSGPTTAPLGTASEAVRVIEAAGLWHRLPAAVRFTLQEAQTRLSRPVASGRVQNQLVGSNRQSLAALVTKGRGKVMDSALCGPVEDAARQIARDIRLTQDPLLFWGGETTVTVTGSGKGGRNQELALRVLRHLQGESGAKSDKEFGKEPAPWAFLSAGSDGIDGPTDAAGGLVTSALPWTPALDAALADNNAYPALKDLGALFIPGATGTNVADFQIFLRA